MLHYWTISCSAATVQSVCFLPLMMVSEYPEHNLVLNAKSLVWVAEGNFQRFGDSAYLSHPEQWVSAVHPRCRCCEAGRSGEPGSGHRCWTCTAEPGWYLKSQSNIKWIQRQDVILCLTLGSNFRMAHWAGPPPHHLHNPVWFSSEPSFPLPALSMWDPKVDYQETKPLQCSKGFFFLSFSFF